jgi:hypothetical protein
VRSGTPVPDLLPGTTFRSVEEWAAADRRRAELIAAGWRRTPTLAERRAEDADRWRIEDAEAARDDRPTEIEVMQW